MMRVSLARLQSVLHDHDGARELHAADRDAGEKNVAEDAAGGLYGSDGAGPNDEDRELQCEGSERYAAGDGAL